MASINSIVAFGITVSILDCYYYGYYIALPEISRIIACICYKIVSPELFSRATTCESGSVEGLSVETEASCGNCVKIFRWIFNGNSASVLNHINFNCIIDKISQRLGYGLCDRVIRVPFPMGTLIFLFATMSRPALGPSQPPVIEQVPDSLCPRIKKPGHGADHSLPSSPER
jgi:hypothetical protein